MRSMGHNKQKRKRKEKEIKKYQEKKNKKRKQRRIVDGLYFKMGLEKLLARPHLEAILVIFGRRALIFFV